MAHTWDDTKRIVPVNKKTAQCLVNKPRKGWLHYDREGLLNLSWPKENLRLVLAVYIEQDLKFYVKFLLVYWGNG